VKSLFWQRLTHKWKRKLKDPKQRKELILHTLAKILAGSARKQRDEDEPWRD